MRLNSRFSAGEAGVVSTFPPFRKKARRLALSAGVAWGSALTVALMISIVDKVNFIISFLQPHSMCRFSYCHHLNQAYHEAVTPMKRVPACRADIR